MDAGILKTLEERASAAERRLAALEGRLGSGTSASVPTEVVAELQGVLALLQAAQQENAKLKQDLAQATAAQAALEVDNSKLRYQVKHLKRSVQQLDGSSAA